MKVYDGEVYVAHKGMLSVVRGGVRVDLLTGFRGGLFHRRDRGRRRRVDLLGNGTVTNSGVVGADNYDKGWLAGNRSNCDAPAQNVTLAGRNFTSPDFFTSNPMIPRPPAPSSPSVTQLSRPGHRSQR